MNSSQNSGFFSWQSASFPGRAFGLKRVFAPRHFAGLACSITSAGRRQALVDYGSGNRRIFFEISSQFVIYDRFYKTADFRVAKLGFRLSFKLRFWQLDTDNGSQALTDILTLQILSLTLIMPYLRA